MIANALDRLTLTVVFDNTAHDTACLASWGFACVIEVPGRTILFDTGSDGGLLIANMRALGIDPAAIDTVVLSHEHWDHVDGLAAFLAVNRAVTVVMPAAFTGGLKAMVTGTGAELIQAHDPYPVCPHVATTGEMGGGIIEQGLVIGTSLGPVVITGCAHPGIVPMLRDIGHRHRRPIRLVLGGFHLKDMAAAEINEIITAFRELGIMYAGPTHCTGGEAIGQFADAYGGHFVSAGVGRVISLDDIG